MKKIGKVIFFIWSLFPIMSITDDANFGTIEELPCKEMRLRFSLGQIMCGAIKFYFITWKKDENGQIRFSIVQKIAIRDCYKKNRKKIKKLCSKYEKYLMTIDENQVNDEKEDLCYHIENESGRIEISDSKINTYTTIVLTVIPIVMALVDWGKIWNTNIGLKIMLGVVGYSLMNIVIYIYSYLKVASYDRYGFHEMKVQEGSIISEKERHRNRNKLLYRDWQNLRIDANIKVSYVLNVQKWVAVAFCISVFIMVVA